MEEEKKPWALHILFIFMASQLCSACCCLPSAPTHLLQENNKNCSSRFPSVVTKENRRVVSHTESGTVFAADLLDGSRGKYHLQFITLDPGSLLLPVLLHADMLFYVHTGRGSVNWVDEDGKKSSLEVVKGDVYSLQEGSVLYIRSYRDPMREKLRIHAIFNTINEAGSTQIQEDFVGSYTRITDLVLGFDERVLQIGFGVSEEVIQRIKMVERPPSIVPFLPKGSKDEHKDEVWEMKKKKKKDKKDKSKAFNVFQRDPDVQNCNGWSLAVTGKDLKALKDSDLGVFMVNLTKGSMIGPHWNPLATEMAVVIHGLGMIQILCPNNSTDLECQSSSFIVQEGDAFLVPRFHPMAQMAFNNDSFVFMGFSTRASYNHPQFLAGKRSVLQVIEKEILAVAFNAPNTTAIEILLQAQEESIILECTSCAEEAEKKMDGEERKREEREEEERERKEEEERREEQEREEEEAKKRQEEEEERERKEEEERREEQEREEEEAKKRQEEEERKRKEEAKKKEEEEWQKKEEEKEARKRKEEEEAARKREEEESRKREEEIIRIQDEEEEEQMEIWEHHQEAKREEGDKGE